MKKINFEGFQLVFSDAEDGNLSFKCGDESNVKKNRDLFFQSSGINNANLNLINKTHSSNVLVIDDFGQRKLYKNKAKVLFDVMEDNQGYDGLLVSGNMIVGLLAGDCIPLIVVEPKTLLHGIIHVGILGLINNIVNNLVPIADNLNIDIKDFRFYIGPSIRYSKYDLSKSGLWKMILDKYKEESSLFNKYIFERGDSTYLSMQSMLIDQLLSIGVKESAIIDSGECSTDGYYSNFAAKNLHGEDGRFISIVSISE